MKKNKKKTSKKTINRKPSNIIKSLEEYLQTWVTQLEKKR